MFGDEALQVEVDVRVERSAPATGSRSGRAPASRDDAAARVDFDEPTAFLAAQLRLVLLLESLPSRSAGPAL